MHIPSQSSSSAAVPLSDSARTRSAKASTAEGAAFSVNPLHQSESLSLQARSPLQPLSLFGASDTTPTWGSQTQLEASVRELEDLEGNRDGLWSNEGEVAGHTGGFTHRNPLGEKIRQGLKGMGDRQQNMTRLTAFVDRKQVEWNAPVSQLRPDQLKNGALFLAQKAMALTRMERHPSTVQDGFIQASGSVNGQSIADRQLFYQRFSPTAEPSGKLVLVSPGFQETGRHFYEQIQLMNAAGHDVVVMDHQWAGQSEGEAGGIDRGYGVARDVAAMTAAVAQMQQTDYPDGEVILFGNSMGGGPGVLGALTLNENQQIALNGPAMPQHLKAVLQAPFIEVSDNWVNDGVGLGSKIPFLNEFALPSAGVPVLTHDAVAAQKGAQQAVLEDIRARLSAMSAATDDMNQIKDLIRQGRGPTAPVAIAHGNQDPLADPAGSQWLAEQLGAELKIIDSANHVLEQSPQEQKIALELLDKL